jgi:hypothetical protein
MTLREAVEVWVEKALNKECKKEILIDAFMELSAGACRKQKDICCREWGEQRERLIQYGPEKYAILYAPLATSNEEDK